MALTENRKSFAFNVPGDNNESSNGVQDVSVSVAAAPEVAAGRPQEESTRVYHDEHFAAGRLQPNSNSPFGSTAVQRQSTSNLVRPSGNNGRLSANGDASGPLAQLPFDTDRPSYARGVTTCEGITKQITQQADPQVVMAPALSMGTPMPKWPANWQSAAFEAVAVKKSYILSPPEIYAECAHHGEEKAKYSWYKLVLLCFVAGCYVGFGYTTCLQVGGLMDQAPSNKNEDEVNIGVFKALFGAMGFPFGFTAIVVCGAELYTSLCAYMMAAWWEGKVDMLTCIRMWVVSWCGNFAGCAFMVGMLYASGIFEHKDEYVVFVAEDKVRHGWGAVLVKGIFANWLVGIATWMANAAQDLTGKFVGIWLPISAFAAIGFEHCIANMFLIPLAISHGANISAKQFVWNNLIPATLGNWIGGGVCIATTYAFVYGRTPLRIRGWYYDSVEPNMPWAAAKKTK